MKTRYTLFHFVATVLACAAVAYQTAVLMEAYVGVSEVTKWGIPLATITAALLPVIAESAHTQGERAKAWMLCLPVLVLIAFVLPSAVSRLGEAQEARVAVATKTQVSIATIQADIKAQRAAVAQAEAWKVGECKSGLGPKCTAQTKTYEQRLAYLEKLEGRLDRATPEPTPWLPAWHPALMPIGLELAIWTGFFFGLGPLARRSAAKALTDVKQLPAPVLKAETVVEAPKVLTAKMARELADQGQKQQEIAAAFGINQGRVSELLSGRRELVVIS